MDQHGEKEAENKSQDSTDQRRQDDATAAAVEEDTSAQESVAQGAGHKAEESPGLLIKEVAGSGEESSPPALFAHPCSLLQLLLRACAGCLGLHGYCCASDPKPPVAAAVAAPDAAAAADSSQEGEGGGGDKANYLYMQGEVVTRVWAVRKPSRPREGSGGNGGAHH